MATRLYPVTTDPRVLERLAGVPEGTHEKLAAIREKYARARRAEDAQLENLDSQEFEDICNDLSAARYNTFILFGWGRISNLRLIDRGYDLAAGSETQFVRVMQILDLQRIDLQQHVDFKGVTFAEIGGVRWG